MKAVWVDHNLHKCLCFTSVIRFKLSLRCKLIDSYKWLHLQHNNDGHIGTGIDTDMI